MCLIYSFYILVPLFFQGSERLHLLVSDSSSACHMLKCKEKEDDSEQILPDSSSSAACNSPWVSCSSEMVLLQV